MIASSDRRRHGEAPQEKAAALLARMRAGDVSQDQLALAAHLGYPPARILLPEPATSMLVWLSFLARFEERDHLVGRIALALAELVLRENPRLRDSDRSYARAIAALADRLEGRANDLIGAAEAVRDSANELGYRYFSAGPGNSLPSVSAADAIAECVEVPEEWTKLGDALWLTATVRGQSHAEGKPPGEALLEDLSETLGPWALQAKLTRRES